MLVKPAVLIFALLAASSFGHGECFAEVIGGYLGFPMGSTSDSRTLECAEESSCEAPVSVVGGLAWDGVQLWVGHLWGEALIHSVDPTTCETLGSVPAPALHIGGLAFDGTDLWCVAEQAGEIYRISTFDGTVLVTIPAPSFGQTDPDGAGLAWDGSHLWHADYGSGSIYKLDPGDGEILLELDLGLFGAAGLCYADGQLYVSEWAGETLIRVDPSSGATSEVCYFPGSHPMGLAALGDRLWLAAAEFNELFEVDPDTVTAEIGWGAIKLNYR